MRLKDFMKSGHPPTLFSAFLYFDISFMVWVLVGVLGVYISKDFGLTATQKGLMAAIPLLGGSLVRIPLGLLVDHIGPKKTGIIGQLLVIIPLAGVWLFSTTFDQVLAFGFLLGIAGGSFAVALPLASRWYPPKHQGIALGIARPGNNLYLIRRTSLNELGTNFLPYEALGVEEVLEKTYRSLTGKLERHENVFEY